MQQALTFKRDSFLNVLFWSHTLLMSHSVGVRVGNTPKLAKHLGISLGEVCWFQGNICADTWKRARIPHKVEHKGKKRGNVLTKTRGWKTGRSRHAVK